MGAKERGATAGAALAVLVLAGGAYGQCVTEFATTPGTGPSAITAGPDGNVWVGEFGEGNVSRILASSPNTVTDFNVSTEDIRIAGVTGGPDGNVWFVEIFGNAVGRIQALAPNTITEFPIPTGSSKPQDITTGPDGNLWFTQAGDAQIGRITPGAPNTITEFTIPSGLGPVGITAGPDGNLWFAEAYVAGNEGGNKIGRITPGAPNTITEFTIPTAGGSPIDITAGPDGNLWFTEIVGKIGRITPYAPNTITEFPIATANSRPLGIAAGPDGNLWFAEANGRKVGRITPESPNTITEFGVPASDITRGPDGNLWFSDLNEIVGRLQVEDCQGCVAGKLRSIARSEKETFDCLAKAAKTGDASGVETCVAKSDAKFSAAYETAGECGSPELACGSNVDQCVSTVSGLLPEAPSSCAAAKLKAAGKLAAAELACAVKSASRNRPVDASCLARARKRFAAAFDRAEASGACSGAADLVQAVVEFFCVANVRADDSSGRVMAAICR